MRTLADLRRLGEASGCKLVSAHRVDGELVGHFVCPDVVEGRPMATATLLQGLTSGDDDGEIPPELVQAVRSAGALAPQVAHAVVRDGVEFREEKIETFQSPAATLRRGYGDCDDSARALVGLAHASGIPARLVAFTQEGTPAHVTAVLWDGDHWQWAETTIGALFGEHPFSALVRLGGKRPDLDGVPVALTEGPAGGTMGAMGDTLVQRIATPVTSQSLADALAAAWPSSVGGNPGSAIQVLVAQSAFETGAWKAVWNNNLGNVKYSGGTDYFQMTASEGSGASTTMVASSWRSYPTLATGAAAWLTFMANNYASALAYAEQGDVTDFVSALKSTGYFTGDLGQYTAGVQAYYSQYSGISPSATQGQIDQAVDVVDGTVSETSAAAVVAAATGLGALLAWLLA